MSPNVLSTRLPWQDRWTQPTLLQLLEPLKIQHRRLFEQLMAELADFDQVDQVILWYGSAWNWTIQYQLHDEALSPAAIAAASNDPADDPKTLVYLVPRVETPIICIPLSDQIIQQLPMKRLNRFIRDGIKNAKCAVAIHWATWTPNSKAEVGFLADLLKRKCKLIMGAADKADKADKADGEPVVTKGKGKGKKAKGASPITLEEDAGQTPDVEHPPLTKTGKPDKTDKTSQGKSKGKTSKGKTEASSKTSKKSTKAAGKTAKATKPAAAKSVAAKSAKPSKTAKTAKPVKAGKISKAAKPTTPAKPAKTTKASVSGKAAGKSSSKTSSKSSGKTAGQSAAKSKAGGKSASKAKVATATKTSKSTKTVKTVKAAKGKTAAKASGKSAGKSAGKPSAKRVSKSTVATSSRRKR